MSRSLSLTVLVAVAFLAGGCRQGPGATRAFGVLAGTAAGAALGAAATPCYPGGGALAGAALGMTAGSLVGDAVACDQERRGCRPCGRCRACTPRPVPRRTVIHRRVYVVPEGGGEPVPAEEVIIEEEVVDPGGGYGYGGS